MSIVQTKCAGVASNMRALDAREQGAYVNRLLLMNAERRPSIFTGFVIILKVMFKQTLMQPMVLIFT
jgi:hypothetical protein